MNVANTIYQATRVTHDCARAFVDTQRRFDEHVPLLDPSVVVDLVIN